MSCEGFSREALAAEIKDILAVQTGRAAADIGADTRLVTDLDLDSVDFLALVAALRERHQVKPDIAWVIRRMRGTTLTTVADLAGFVSEILECARAANGREG